MSTTFFIALGALAAIFLAALAWRKVTGLRPTPPQLRPGLPLPDFRAIDEQGNRVSSADLRGTPSVIMFVRGTWCPFCSAQVQDLTQYYRDITDLGARLILVTPKPLETTRRVAEFFHVEFEFWLDENLSITKKLGLLQEDGVPRDYDREYGRDTIWPTTLVIDDAGLIRYTEVAKSISERPNPRVLLREIRSALKT
jgi:peroxiredoxin